MRMTRSINNLLRSLALVAILALSGMISLVLATPPPPTEPDPEVATEPTLVPVFDTDIPAPIRIDLPDGWLLGSGALPLSEFGEINVVPFTLYTGPVTNGTGYIVLLWGFPNIAPAFPQEGEGGVNLWQDGLRLFYLTIIGTEECNPGVEPEREFEIGGREAIGGFFAVVDCEESPDSQGWFAGLQEEGLNFMFYTYVEPREAINGPARDELQSILDTIEFDLSLLPGS